MEKQELETKEKAFAASLISIVYAFVIQLTQNLTLVPNSQYQPEVAIIVPAIASILFGKFIGAVGAAGGQFVNSAGSGLISKSASTASTVSLTGLSFFSLIKMTSDFVSAYVVGSLTEKPNVQWDSLISRFKSLDTWSRLFQNTLGSVIGFGMVGSLLSYYAQAYNAGESVATGARNFVVYFYLNSAIIVIFIPLTLLLYELGDVFVQMRSHAKDKGMRKLAKSVEKEEAVTIISSRLTENALTENLWTPIQIRFRANLDQETVYRIEAVSTANYYPAFDSTKPLKKGDIWGQKFFIMPGKQKNVDFRVRITPSVSDLSSIEQNNVKETVLSVKAKSYNPNSNSATLILFSIINSIVVGASVAWNNLLTLSTNIDQVVASLKQSWVVIATTGGLEFIIFVPLLMYLRRRWAKSDSESLTVGFGTDLSDRSQRIYQSFEGNVGQFLEYFGVKLQRSVRLFLIFVTTVSVMLLGIEGYNVIHDPSYTIHYPDQFFVIGLVSIILWLGGYKGIDILRSVGIIGEEKYSIQEGSVVSKFKPASDFVSNTPNEVAFTVTNPTMQNGIRFRFLSQDTVSPPLVEMPVPPGGLAVFKTSITPIATGTRNVMVVVYPLFDEQGNYIDENSAEPYTHQSVNYQVQSETPIGISKDQQSTLKKLLMLAVVIGAIIFGGGTFAQQFLGSGTSTNLIKNNAPFLLVLQAPFVYAYFYLQNNAKVMKGEMESLVEKINEMDNISKDMNQKLDKSVVKSKKFSKEMKTALATTMASVAGLSALKEINNMISKQIKDSLGENFTQEITKEVKNQDLTLFSDTASKVISDNFTSEIQKTINKEKENILPAEGSSQITTDQKNGLKQIVKDKVKEDFGDKIKKQTAKQISVVLKDKSSDSIINTYKTNIMANLKKQISKQLKKEIKDGSLTNDIQNQVFKAIEPEIQEKILDNINNIVFNRDMLSSLAEEFDNKLGTNLTTDFEDAIGTSMENEMADELKQRLSTRYEKELMQKLETKIKRQINTELNKQSDKIIDELLNSKLTDEIQTKVLTTLQDSLTNSVDGIVNTAIDTSIDVSVDAIIP